MRKSFFQLNTEKELLNPKKAKGALKEEKSSLVYSCSNYLYNF